MKNAADKAMSMSDIRQILTVAGLATAMVLFSIAANLPVMIEMAQAGQMRYVVGWQCGIFAAMATAVQLVYVFSEPLPKE